MIKKIIHSTIQLVLVAILSAIIAYLLGIDDYILVGTIGILSVSLTKTETVSNGIKRYLDVVYGLLLSTLIFSLFGFDLVGLVIFLVVFIASSFAFKIEVGLVPSLVLARHVYQFGSYDFMFLLEEIGILSIGVGVAVVVSLLYPSAYQKEINRYVSKVDLMIKDHLFMLAIILKSKEDFKDFMTHYKLINQSINEAIKKAEIKEKDKLFSNDHRYLAYLYMRQNQLSFINTMYEATLRIKETHPFQLIISDYINTVVDAIGKHNKASDLLEKLNQLRINFSKEALPKTRNEFETRALLYHMLADIEAMLKVKVSFHERYPDFNVY